VGTAEQEYRDRLFQDGLLIPTGVPGVYGKSAEFEDTVDRLNAMVTALSREDGATVLRFPPVLNRAHLEKSGYLGSFPQLAGSVHSFAGDERAHRELLSHVEQGTDWSAGLPRTEVMLTPAACYPVYPALAAAGPLPPGGRLVDVLSYCYRHEPSDDPARMQSFRMRENVRLAEPASVKSWRQVWFERAERWIETMGLAARLEVANDPFFGRGGKLLAQSQRDLQLKFEVVAPIVSTERPTAIISLNYHEDHFGHLFDLRTADGAFAHTSCIGFGLERITLALYRAHGNHRARWPAAARDALGL
jgi:seryl-tRNA synthetase